MAEDTGVVKEQPERDIEESFNREWKWLVYGLFAFIFVVLVSLASYIVYVIFYIAPLPEPGPVINYNSFVDGLRLKSANVVEAGNVSYGGFKAQGRALIVNGDEVYVFEYNALVLAYGERRLVSPRGDRIGKYRVFGKPYFFWEERIIVMYFGDDPQLLKTLSELLGVPFAGELL